MKYRVSSIQHRVSVALTLAIVFATTAIAQQQGSGQANSSREKYKYTFQLMQMVSHIGEIDKNKKYTLTSAQAKALLAVLKPLRTQPKLTQDQAKAALIKLKKPLTVAQLNAMARIKPKVGQRRPGGGPGGPPNGQRPAGQQGQRHFDPNAMKDFNPFYSKVDKKDTRAVERAKRWNDFSAALEKKAKSK